MLRELIDALKARGQLVADADVAQLVTSILGGGGFPDTAVANLTEFTRDVHAEAEALMSAARRGASVRCCTLFATTFPCHNCAKHIVAAGIGRVVYREPYAKSYARDFYMDSIEVDGERRGRVSFVPFIGVAPRRYLQWFTMRERKQRDGRLIEWKPFEASPAFYPADLDLGYIERERGVVDELAGLVQGLASNVADDSGRAQQ